MRGALRLARALDRPRGATLAGADLRGNQYFFIPKVRAEGGQARRVVVLPKSWPGLNVSACGSPARPSRRPSRPPGACRPRRHPLSPRYAAGAPRVALHSARGGSFGRAAATRSLALPHSCTDLCAPSAATRALRSPRTPSRRHLDSRRRRSSRASRAGWSTLTAAWATRAGWRSSGSRGSLGGARCGRCEQAGAVGEARRADASGVPNGRVGVRQASKAGS